MPMGQENTTFNIDELISSYIDNQIFDPELKSQIEAQLTADEKLMAKYKSELLTKNLLHTRLPDAPLPEETYRKVMFSIDSLISRASAQAKQKEAIVPEYPSFWQSLMEQLQLRFSGYPDTRRQWWQ